MEGYAYLHKEILGLLSEFYEVRNERLQSSHVLTFFVRLSTNNITRTYSRVKTAIVGLSIPLIAQARIPVSSRIR